VPIEQYGDQIGCQIMPAIGGVGEIIEAWLGATLYHEYGLYPDEEPSLQVANLGQASKEGVVVDGVSPCLPPSDPIQCQTLTDGGVTVDAVHG